MYILYRHMVMYIYTYIHNIDDASLHSQASQSQSRRPYEVIFRDRPCASRRSRPNRPWCVSSWDVSLKFCSCWGKTNWFCLYKYKIYIYIPQGSNPIVTWWLRGLITLSSLIMVVTILRRWLDPWGYISLLPQSMCFEDIPYVLNCWWCLDQCVWLWWEIFCFWHQKRNSEIYPQVN